MFPTFLHRCRDGGESSVECILIISTVVISEKFRTLIFMSFFPPLSIHSVLFYTMLGSEPRTSYMLNKLHIQPRRVTYFPFLLTLKKKIFILCTWMFCLSCMSLYHLHLWCPQRPEEGFRSSGTGVTDNCEPPCGGWSWTWVLWRNRQLIVSHLVGAGVEQTVLLPGELSFQLQEYGFSELLLRKHWFQPLLW